MRFTFTLLLIGLAVAVLVYAGSEGRFLFLPLILLFPLGFFFRSRRR